MATHIHTLKSYDIGRTSTLTQPVTHTVTYTDRRRVTDRHRVTVTSLPQHIAEERRRLAEATTAVDALKQERQQALWAVDAQVQAELAALEEEIQS